MCKKITESIKIQILLIILNCVLVFFSFFEYRILFLNWIWPITTLLIFRLIKNKKIFFIACISIFISTYLSCINSLGSLEGDLFLAIINFIYIFICFWVYRLLFPVLNVKIGAFATLLLPLICTALYNIENNITSLMMSLGGLQYDMTIFSQCVSVIGAQGFNFILIMMAAVVVYVLENKNNPKKYKLLLVSYICILFALFLYGGIKLSLSKYDGDDTVRVAMTLTSQDCTFLAKDAVTTYDDNISYLNDRISEAASCNADIVCFGEESIFLKTSDQGSNNLSSKYNFLNEVCKIVKNYNIYTVICLEIDDDLGINDGLGENVLYVISNNGEIVGKYEKSWLIPVLESSEYIQGDDKPLYLDIPYKDGKTFGASFAICFDSDYELYPTNMDNNTNILFVPSWIWPFLDPYHNHVCQYRGMENGVSVVNPTICGRSCAYDRYGQCVSMFNQNTTGLNHVGIADVPINYSKDKTIYHYIAPYLLISSIVLTLMYIIFGLYWKIKIKNKK